MGSRCAGVVLAVLVIVGSATACSSGADAPRHAGIERRTPVATPAEPVLPRLRIASRRPIRWASRAFVPLDVSGSRLVRDRDEVLGAWRIVSIATGPVPARAVRGLSIWRAGRNGMGVGYSDAVNLFSVSYNRIGRDGRLGGNGSMSSTLVGCGTRSYACGRPSGFGVYEAVRLRLTAAGDLALMNNRGAAVAIYERVR